MVILHETLHELRANKQNGVIFKIDFEKAYDSVRWDFVEEMMVRKRFDTQLIDCIMSTVRGGKFVLILMGRMGTISKLTGD